MKVLPCFFKKYELQACQAKKHAPVVVARVNDVEIQ